MAREKNPTHPMMLAAQSVRGYVYDALETTSRRARGGLVVSRLIELMIILSLTATVLDTVPALHQVWGGVFDGVEDVSLAVFTLEYALRIWIAPLQDIHHGRPAGLARLNYMLSTQGLLDFAAILPLWIALFGYRDLQVLIVLRVLRIFKFNRYSSGMSSLLDVLWSERRALGGCLVILMFATLLSASAMHVIEGKVQPDKFGTIPDAMWWAIVTLSTIGYGDVVPLTVPGKIVAAMTIVSGLVMIALPVGIVATAFSDVIHRRDFIVTWSMVARVPLFSHLTAGDIAHIMQLLRAQQFDRDEIIVRRGDVAHAMYFIAEGEVEIELSADQGGRRVRLGAGHFFGERAVLKKARRSATVAATVRTRLLSLDAADLRGLIARDSSIAAHINKVALSRGARRAPIPATETEDDDAG